MFPVRCIFNSKHRNESLVVRTSHKLKVLQFIDSGVRQTFFGRYEFVNELLNLYNIILGSGLKSDSHEMI